MKKLIIINQAQFGYNNATYYYCKYLKKEYSIVYIGWDHEQPQIEMEGVRVVYVSSKGNILLRSNRFLRQTLRQLSDKKTVVLIKYFKIVALVLRLCRPGYSFLLDIRTGSVHKIPIMRMLQNARLKFETLFFKNITVISQTLAVKLNLAHKAHILPLGADIISSTDKNFDELRLLYVGSLSNRNIHVTISGLKKFYDEFGKQIPISYTIIGGGLNNEERVLGDLATLYEMTNIINIVGKVPHSKLKVWFDAANIGVSYVPLTEYYDCQPVTKTFEYLRSGMPVIATMTSENISVIHPENGVLVEGTAEAFYLGLKEIFKKKYLFNSVKIRNATMDYSWENIVRKNLEPIIKNLSGKFSKKTNRK